jgi:hypothetical protein
MTQLLADKQGKGRNSRNSASKERIAFVRKVAAQALKYGRNAGDFEDLNSMFNRPFYWTVRYANGASAFPDFVAMRRGRSIERFLAQYTQYPTWRAAYKAGYRLCKIHVTLLED